MHELAMCTLHATADCFYDSALIYV